MDMFEPTHGLEVPPPSLIVGVAINGSKRSAHALRWALVKFVPEGRTVFKLLYVRPSIQSVPTPMGNHVPISQVREDVADAYKSEMEWQTSSMLLPFKQLCVRQKVDVEAKVIEADDIALGISSEVAKLSISDLVIGASSSSMFARKLSSQTSTRISESAPKSCTVYVISKGKLSSVRSSNSETIESINDRRSDTSSSVDSPLSYKSSLQTDQSSADPFSRDDPSFPNQSLQALLTMNKTLLSERPTVNLDRTSSVERPTVNLDRNSSVEASVNKKDIRSSYSMGSDTGHSRESSFRRFGRDFPSWDSDQESFADGPSNSPSSQIQEDVTFELERLKIELRHVRGMYAVAQNETINASRQLNNLSKRRTEEAAKLDEISSREERAREIVRKEMEKQEAVKREAEILIECLNREAAQRKKAESRAARDAKEKENLEKALGNPGHQNMKFTWEEIVSATSSFSEDLRIGKGAFGTVYKCTLHHVTAAVKVLHSKEGHNSKEFQQELEILSRIRHPHMVLLLGVCLDRGCLVYEYLENGSLEDRLFRKDNTPPIPWFERFRIAWEVASALLFLHSSKPKPIIHRDLKPANILLDQNLTSKIGDVGLSTSLNTMNSAMSSIYGKSGPVGTLCYIDPEYQRSGFFSPKSDVYAFGMVILQLLTAKPALALAYNVETALDEGNLIDILDKEAGNWPVEETLELAVLGMSCVELSLKDRPDLESEVLPVLERLKGVVDKAQNSAPSVQLAPPNHFICPLLKEVMENPYVATDGYTYERKAIEQWFEGNEKSPMTDKLFRDQNLTPNYTLLAAIMEWKCKTQ